MDERNGIEVKNESKDLISRLPDNILYHILSILTRKDACKTSILSRRWRSLQYGLHSAPMYEVPYEDNCSKLTLGCCNLIQYHIDFNKLKGLVTLILDVVIIDEAVMASMLSTCTLLEGLTLDACNVVSNLIVTGPPSLRLKKLKLRYCSTKKIEISAANLIAFDFSGDITRISSFSAPRLLKVHFYTGTKASTFAHGLAQFASHPCLENLSLIMYSRTVKEIPQSIPLFKNLKELNMNIWNSSCGSEEDELLWVLFILEATPLLQKLELTVCAQDFFENQLEIRSFSGFSHDQLRRIEMHGFVGNWYEVEFAIYMLESLKKLELMVIDPSTRCYRNGMWANYVDSSWEEKHKPIVQDKLEKVKTSAQLRIL